MAAKRAHDSAKAKAAKEKKLLIALAPVLAIALFFAYHTMGKLHSSSAPPATPAAETTPASTVAAATTPATTTPVTATPVAVISSPAGGKLSRLALFATKDPFHDAGPRAGSTGSPSPSTQTPKKSKPKPVKKTPAAPPTSAVIGVNGKPFNVVVGGAIPLNTAFGAYLRLKSLTLRTATLVIPGQKRPLRLTVGDAIRLKDQAGHTYVIVLFPQATVVSSSPATSTTTTTTTTTGGP